MDSLGGAKNKKKSNKATKSKNSKSGKSSKTTKRKTTKRKTTKNNDTSKNNGYTADFIEKCERYQQEKEMKELFGNFYDPTSMLLASPFMSSDIITDLEKASASKNDPYRLNPLFDEAKKNSKGEIEMMVNEDEPTPKYISAKNKDIHSMFIGGGNHNNEHDEYEDEIRKHIPNEVDVTSVEDEQFRDKLINNSFYGGAKKKTTGKKKATTDTKGKKKTTRKKKATAAKGKKKMTGKKKATAGKRKKKTPPKKEETEE
ncbi:MAG: hypothetical protein ACOCRK_01195 [bacterium]